MTDNLTLDKVKFALQRVRNTSVFPLPKVTWASLIRSDGVPTRIEEFPPELRGLAHARNPVMFAGSGIINGSPGIDVVRFDANDAPKSMNIYHYAVIESLESEADYREVLRVAQLENQPLINDAIRSQVFVLGPFKIDPHWSETIPEDIRNARSLE